ncbi:T9SS type A sorting domain-containing protein [Microvirga sp. STS02]|uniref:T9SS type A sorting domain-containing protein n=1 Tax=Hymenobacter negativus TaxID=2795026 RepID=UPI0018DB4545|nr:MULTISPECIES: T9SS type A sorting domain-containing protein [Bacteria]MBH8568881.1 T9SS type A sorting domain-containing protein [Hymenobacter negativus]MBR7208615.1 T9SS type A sorting domain-containing protein [Microvirga sp. STS02]
MRQLLPLLLLIAVPALAQAQVSPIIDRTDMPATTTTVDSLRLSVASPALPATVPPLTRRGANQTWNYSTLTPASQRVESFVSVAATSLTYAFIFGPFGGANRATVASPQALPLPVALPIPITDSYQFYATSLPAAAQQDFRSVGFGASLSGTAIPVTYASAAQQDVIYRFPLSFASLADSSNSFFSTPAAVATVGYLSQKRKRVNKPDAWGTLITPFGTFQTVRVVTKLIDHDSVAFGGAAGQGFDVPLTREYKWLAKTHHVPLLTITTRTIGGTETVTGVEYRDIYRRIIRTATRDAATDAVLTAYPNPSAIGTPLTLTVPAGSGLLTVSATDVVGRQLFRRSFGSNSGTIRLEAEDFGTFRGVLLLTVQTAQGTATRRLVRE